MSVTDHDQAFMRVLFVGVTARARRRLARALSAVRGPLATHVVAPAQLSHLCAESIPDAIIVGHRPPRVDARDIVRAIQFAAPRVATLVVASDSSERLAVEVIKAGAAGYVTESAGDDVVGNELRTVFGRSPVPAVDGGRAYLAHLLDTLEVGAIRMDHDGRVVDVNAAMGRMLGEAVDTRALCQSSELSQFMARWKARLDRGQCARLTGESLRTVDGMVLAVEGNLHRVSDRRGRILGFQGYLRSIAELTRDRDEVGYRALLLDQVPHAVIAVNEASRVTFWNRSAERVIGWRAAEAIGADVAVLLGGGTLHELKDTVRSALASGAGWQGDVTCKGADGERRDLHCRALSLEAVDGTTEYVGMFVDLTEHKQLESQLQRAVADRDRLLSEAHRRVKANLQLVSSLINIQLARQADSTLRLFAQEVQNRIRAIALLHELLLQSSDCSAVNMQPYIRQITSSLAQAYAQQNSATVECRSDDIWLDIDAAVRVGLIVNELVVNALKYAFAGQISGTVSVSLARTGERSALLEVRDSGIGLPRGAESGASQGHGLRLVIDLARNLGSVAHVERGAGTTFQFRLPIPVQPGVAGD